MITIMLNGESRQVEAHSNVADLLAQLDLADKRLAVEINQEIVPRSCFSEHRLAPGDKVEIVHAIGGG